MPAAPVTGAPLINVEGGDLTIDSAAFSGHATGEVLRVTGGAVRVVHSSFVARTGLEQQPTRPRPPDVIQLTDGQALYLGEPGYQQIQQQGLPSMDATQEPEPILEPVAVQPARAPRRPGGTPVAPSLPSASSPSLSPPQPAQRPTRPSPNVTGRSEAIAANARAEAARAEMARTERLRAESAERERAERERIAMMAGSSPEPLPAQDVDYGMNYNFDDELAQLQRFHRSLVARSLSGQRPRDPRSYDH